MKLHFWNSDTLEPQKMVHQVKFRLGPYGAKHDAAALRLVDDKGGAVAESAVLAEIKLANSFVIATVNRWAILKHPLGMVPLKHRVAAAFPIELEFSVTDPGGWVMLR
jgi:hypothetical protein